MCPVVELAHGGEDPLQVAGQGARVCTIPNTKPPGKRAKSEAVTDSTIRETGASLTLEVVIDVHAGAGDRHAGRRCAGGSRGSGLGDSGTTGLGFRRRLRKFAASSKERFVLVHGVGRSPGPEACALLGPFCHGRIVAVLCAHHVFALGEANEQNNRCFANNS